MLLSELARYTRFLRKMKSIRSFLILCPENISLEVGSFVHRYTDFFIQINDFDQESAAILEFDRIYYIDSEDTLTDELFQASTNNYSVVFSENKKYTAIIFELVKTANLTKEELCFIGESLVRKLMKKYDYLSLSILNQKYTLHLTDKSSKRIQPISSSNKIAIIMLHAGYGDSIMIYQQLNSFSRTQVLQGKEVHLITRSFQGIYKLSYALLEDIKVIGIDVLPDERVQDIITKTNLYERYIVLSLPQEDKQPFHIAQYWEYQLDFLTPFTLSRDLFVIPTLQSEINSLLDDTEVNSQFFVSFQFYTHTDKRKCWNINSVREFALLCKQENIGLLNISPHPYGDIEGLIDLSHFSIPEVFQVINYSNCFVGIDSFGGHIAGVLGIPNITIWGLNYPETYHPLLPDKKNVSFRALQANYSIVNATADIDAIKPSLVFERLNHILNGKIVLPKGRILIEDTLDHVSVEWI